MKKFGILAGVFRHPANLKFLLIMKCSVVILLFTCLEVSANGFSQNKITVNLPSVEMKRALAVIERKSDFRFLYNQALLSNLGKFNLTAQNEDVTTVLTRLLENTPLSFQLLANNLVVLKNRDKVVAEVRVTGKVSDATGAPIQGASVSVKGSSAGTTTDAKGNYAISVPDDATLIFSFIGYLPQEIKVSGRPVLDVTLAESNGKSMDEVVVIGYGTANKRDLTGSIVKIEGKEVADKPNTNPVASLQGKVAGLNVIPSGTPGKAPDIKIRGTVSIGQVTPLYVVDGIFNDNIDYLNPNDIESIEVLKDPSSLAIFGVKGATGVIAITTKKAKAGQVIVNFNTSFGFKKLVDKIKMVDAEGFKTLFAEERANNGVTDPFDYTGLDANTDWIDAVTRTANFNANNLSVTSSTDKNKFNFGVGYTLDQGLIKHEQLDRLLFSVGDEYRINKAFRVGFNINASRQKNPYNTTTDPFDILDAARKVIPQISTGTKQFSLPNPYNVLDTLNYDVYSGLDVGLQSAGVVNPLFRVENEWDKTKSYEYRTVGNTFAEVTFLKNFIFKSTLYADISNVNTRVYNPLYYAYNPKNNTPYLNSQTTKVKEDDYTYRKFQQDHVLNYRKQFGEHSLALTGGFTTYYYSSFQRTGIASQGTDVTSPAIPNDPRFWYITNGFEDKANTSATSVQSEYSTVSYLARALYNFRGKYYLNASFRNDASSRIPPANRNQKFWAVGAAWEISKEDFFQRQTVINFMKLKGSVGVLGNQSAFKADGTPLNYPFYPGLVAGSTAVFGTIPYIAAVPEYVPNPDLRWETVDAQEIGVELSAFNNRLSFEANYFNKTTNNLMTYIDRASLGLFNKLVNGGSLRNSGTELSANWNQNITRDFKMNISGNITFLKNKVLSLSDELPTGVLTRGFQNNGSAESRTTAGYPIASFYGYVVDGIFQNQAEIDKSPDESSLGTPVRPGDFKFKDLNGDNVINSSDRTFIGNPSPKYTYGGSVNFSYRAFSLGVDVQGSNGAKIFRTWGSLESPFQRVNYPAEKLGRWHGEGTSNTIPLISQQDRLNYNGSTYNIESGNYFRIRNIQIAYAFPQAMMSRAKLKALRIYANVQNLKTFKKNLGYAPEYGGFNAGGDATAFGFDNANGALPMIGTLGLNVTF